MYLQTLTLLRKYWPYVISVIALILCGLALGWMLWKPGPPVPEVYAKASHQTDGSLIVEKRPDPAAKPVHQIPKGAKVERIVKVTVQAKHKEQVVSNGNGTAESVPREQAAPETGDNSSVPCPPVTLDLSLVRLPDETRRVIASSPGGEILSALDIPVEAARPVPKPKLWAVGVNFEPFNRTLGGWVDKDFDPQGWLGWLRVGAEVNQLREGSIRDVEGRAKIGFRF